MSDASAVTIEDQGRGANGLRAGIGIQALRVRRLRRGGLEGL